jgi:hypothetical protein
MPSDMFIVESFIKKTYSRGQRGDHGSRRTNAPMGTKVVPRVDTIGSPRATNSYLLSPLQGNVRLKCMFHSPSDGLTYIFHRDGMDKTLLSLLTKDEIKVAAHPYCFSRTDARSRNSMITNLQHCPGDVRERITKVAEDKRDVRLSRKRQSQHERSQRYLDKRKKQRLEGDDPIAHTVVDFLDLPTDNQRLDCHRAFLTATSNEALAQGVCASCA